MCDLNGLDIMYGQYIVPPSDKMVKFGVGQPSSKMLPLDLIKEGMNYTFGIKNKSLLQYGDIQGYKQFRECLAEYLTKGYSTSEKIVKVNSDELFITNGITDGLSFFCSIFTETGTIIYVEEPTYFLAINIFKNDFKLKIVPLPIQIDGLDLDALEKELYEGDNTKLRVLYTIPTFHNPTSYTMSHEKRIRLSNIANNHENFIILADEVYQLLYFDESSKPPLPLCYYINNSISLGSFSKILAPSLRLGWMQIKNKDIMSKFIGCGQMDSSGGKSPFVQSIIHGIIMSGGLNKNLQNCRNFLSNGCRSLSTQIKKKLSDFIEFIEPTGGYFLWLKLKQPYKASVLVKIATEYKIQFIPGTRFSAHENCDNYIRLSFSYYDVDGLILGVDRMVDMFVFLRKKYNENIKDCLKVSILGHKGKLGSRIVSLLHMNNDKIVFNGGLNRQLSQELLESSDCIIDVSSPEGTENLLSFLRQQNKYIPIVIGTTGFGTIENIKEYSKKAPIALISNFSKGMPQFIELLKHVNEEKWDISMSETHGVHKKDIPSGTAKTLVGCFDKHIPIKSIREGETIGEHEVVMNNINEIITIKHQALTKDVFAIGAIKFAKWIVTKSPGLYFEMKNPEIQFSKYSGCGNDFIIMNSNTNIPTNIKDFVNSICSRGNSIGADGVILVKHIAKNNAFTWVYYNKDGNSVEMCGNGARCVVQYLIDNKLIKNKKDLYLINNFGITTLVLFKNDTFSIEMPDPIIKEKHVKLMKEVIHDIINVSLLQVGVPHLVYHLNDNLEVPDPNTVDKSTKQDVNINVFSKYGSKFIIRTYERGVYDETLACGSGCCACAYQIAIADNIKSPTDYTFAVKSGDNITVKVVPGDQWKLYLSGPAKKIYNGTIIY